MRRVVFLLAMPTILAILLLAFSSIFDANASEKMSSESSTCHAGRERQTKAVSNLG